MLVVEDSPGAREYLVFLLSDAGYDVVTAVDASEAIERLKRDAPAVVITDLDLAWGNGMAIGAFVKRLSTTRVGVPVIVLSAKAGEEWETEARAEGIFACLRKPFDPEVLQRVVSEALGARNA